MSILWMDGFDHYGTYDRSTQIGSAFTNMQKAGYNMAETTRMTLLPKGTHAVDGAYMIGGRTGPIAPYIVDSGGFSKPIATCYQIGFGIAWYFPYNFPNTGGCTVSILNSYGENQGSFTCTHTGQLDAGWTDVYGNWHSFFGGASTPTIKLGAWNYIEGLLDFSDISNPTVTAQCNGVLVYSGPCVGGLTSSFFGHNTREFCQVSITGGGGTGYFVDDFIIWDTIGYYNNWFTGPLRVGTVYPAGDTVTAQWEIVGANTGYNCINQTAPDGSNNYLRSAASDVAPINSSFTMDPTPSVLGAIKAVQITTSVNALDASMATMQTEITTGTTTTSGPVYPVLSGAFYYYNSDMFEFDPSTEAPWTKTSLDSAVINIKRVS